MNRGDMCVADGLEHDTHKHEGRDSSISQGLQQREARLASGPGGGA